MTREDLLSDLPRGRDAKTIGQAPFSHFESIANIAATRSLDFEPKENKAGKIFLGVVGGTVVDESNRGGWSQRYVKGGKLLGILDDRHHLLIGPSRSTKGRAVIVPNLLMLPANASCLCIDPKGENTRLTAWWRARLQPVAVLDPTESSGALARQYKAKFNPLNTLARCERSQMVAYARMISDSLIVPGDFKEKHWDATATQFLSALIVHVATYPRYASCRDLVTVRHLISEAGSTLPGSKERWLETEMMMSNGTASNFVINGARQFYQRTGGEFSSVLSNLRKHTDWIDLEFIQESLVGEGIDLRDLKRSAMSVYAVVDAMHMSMLSGWLRMLVQMTLAAHEQERNQLGPSTLLALDEFNILGRLEPLEVAAAQIAGLGVKLMPVIQDLGQLKSRYPNSWETFAANSGVIQVIAPNDMTTCEYFSRKLGTTVTLSRSTNAPTFDQATQQGMTGESWGVANHPLLDPEELSRFFARNDPMCRQLILRPGYRPAIIQRAYYDKHLPRESEQ
jgi:type IV secretion system protein VirD4